MISNIKLKGLGVRKGLNQIKLTWGYFVKNSLLIYYFLVNLRFFSWDFCVFWNVPCKAFYSGKNGVWNGSQTMWDSFQTSTIIAENTHFSYFWNPSCVRRNVPMYACFGPCRWAEGHFGHLLPKIDFCSFQKLYFPL